MPIPWTVPVRRLYPYEPLFRDLAFEFLPMSKGRTGAKAPNIAQGHIGAGDIAGAVWTPTRYGAGLQFDGVRYTDYIDWGFVGLHQSHDDAWSFEVLITEFTTLNDRQSLFNEFDRGAGDDGWEITIGDNGDAGTFLRYAEGGNSVETPNGAISTTAPTHAVMACEGGDGGALRYYINGALFDTDALGGGWTLTTGKNLRSGFPANPDTAWKGLDATIALIRWWKRELVASEAMRLYEICLGQQMQPMWVTPPVVAAAGVPRQMDYYRRRRVA